MDAIIIGKIDLDKSTTIKDVKVERKGRLIYFSVPHQISSSQALDLQADLGYIAAGYGFYGFKDSVKETTWFCGDSCD